MPISVIVPTYNRGPLVQKTLDSIVAQTLSPLEIIVVDDGSTDSTPHWIENHYGDKIRVIRHANGGVARARNRGLEEASGEFIAFLDHDDLWHPHKLEVQLAALKSNPKAALVWTKWREVNETGTPLALEKHLWAQPFWKGRSGKVLQDFVPKNLILSASIPLIRARFLREAGGFDPRTAPSDDWDLWLRLARKHPFVFVDEVTVDYVWHEQNQSRDELKMWRASQRALIKHWPLLWKRPRALWLVVGYAYFLKAADPFYQNARFAVGRGDWHEVKKQMRAVIWRYPLSLFTAQWVYLLIRLLRRDSRPI